MKVNNDNSAKLLAKGKISGANTPTAKIKYEIVRRFLGNKRKAL